MLLLAVCKIMEEQNLWILCFLLETINLFLPPSLVTYILFPFLGSVIFAVY